MALEGGVGPCPGRAAGHDSALDTRRFAESYERTRDWTETTG